MAHAQGDRVGICMTKLAPDTMERGLVSSPGSVPTFSGALITVLPHSLCKGCHATSLLAPGVLLMAHQIVSSAVESHSLHSCARQSKRAVENATKVSMTMVHWHS